MNRSISNLLRRTLVFAAAALGLAAVLPATAQQTVILNGQTALGSCTYNGGLTVAPNGTLSVTCVSGTSTSAVFSLSGPASLAVGTTTTASVSRAGGTGSIAVNYAVGGACSAGSGTLTFAEGGAAQSFPITAGAAAGTCTVSITPGTGATASPSTINIAVSDPNAVPPPVGDCPAPAPDAMTTPVSWSLFTQLRMNPGQIGYFPVDVAPAGRNSLAFTQGQQPSTPSNVVTEMSLSKCKGVVFSDPADSHYVPQCYLKTTYTNIVKLTIFTRPVTQYGWVDQASLGNRGCWAPETGGPWYVNVRWTYASCQYSTGCGFTVQWVNGPL